MWVLSHVQLSIRIYAHSVNTDNIKVRCLVDEMVFSGNELVFVKMLTSYLNQINCEDAVTFKLKMTQKHVTIMVYLDMDIGKFLVL